ncbi:MAG: hypothetical protein F4103_19605 [Boseongicola sp. SB0673_bin_14]|nr:hypothetical protein [Boseongicola sp. SB0673_bin_14]
MNNAPEYTPEEIQREADRLLTTGAGADFVERMQHVARAQDVEGVRELMDALWMLFGVGLFCCPVDEIPADWPRPEVVRCAVAQLKGPLTELARLTDLSANLDMQHNRN